MLAGKHGATDQEADISTSKHAKETIVRHIYHNTCGLRRRDNNKQVFSLTASKGS
jgi:hypothetical protein